MNSISKLSCAILVTLPMVAGCQTVVAQEKLSPPFTPGNDNPLKVFIAESNDHDTRDSPPSLHSVAVRTGEDNTPEQKLQTLAGLIEQYLGSLLVDENSEIFGALMPALDYEKVDFDDKFALLDWGEELITGLAEVTNQLITTDKESASTRALAAGFSGFALSSLINDFKCRALNELAIAVGINFTQIPAKLGEKGYCEIPGLGKISEWNFNADPKERYGEFSLQDMKIDRYEVRYDAGSDTVIYSLVDQLSYDWRITVDAYDVWKRRLQTDYINEISDPANADADPFEPHLDYPKALDSSVNYPSLPKEMKNPFVDGETIWNRNLLLRIFAHGEVIKPEEVIETRFKVFYPIEGVPLDITQLELNDEGDPIEYKDVYNQTFHRRKATPDSVVSLPANHAYRQVSVEACIDLMVAQEKVPETLSELLNPDANDQKDPLGYCLGRCAQPLIANSK